MHMALRSQEEMSLATVFARTLGNVIALTTAEGAREHGCQRHLFLGAKRHVHPLARAASCRRFPLVSARGPEARRAAARVYYRARRRRPGSHCALSPPKRCQDCAREEG